MNFSNTIPVKIGIHVTLQVTFFRLTTGVGMVKSKLKQCKIRYTGNEINLSQTWLNTTYAII